MHELAASEDLPDQASGFSVLIDLLGIDAPYRSISEDLEEATNSKTI